MAKTMDDAFVPECKENGDYGDVQCFEHEGFSKQCWCVTKDGQEIKGTRTSDGQTPDCTGVNKEEKKLEKQPDKPTEPKQEKPAYNNRPVEVDIQVMVNDTKTSRLFQKINHAIFPSIRLENTCASAYPASRKNKTIRIILKDYSRRLLCDTT